MREMLGGRSFSKNLLLTKTKECMLEMQGILSCSRSLASSKIQSSVTKNKLKTVLATLALSSMSEIQGFIHD